MTGDVPGVLINERMTPFSTSISYQALQALRSMVGADGVPLNALHDLAAPDDQDACDVLPKALPVITGVGICLRVPRFLIQVEGEFPAFIRPRSWLRQQHIRPG